MVSELETELKEKIDGKTKPIGSLGRIETLALQMGLLQGSASPVMERCRLLIMAADHGIAEEGVSAYPQEVTAQMVLNFLGGGAAANVFATALDVELRVIDAGIKAPVDHPNLQVHRLGNGTRNSAKVSAMSGATLDEALEIGAELGRGGQVQAVCLGEMGIGNTSAATLMAHKITQLPIEDLIGRGTGLDDDGLEHKLGVLEKAAARTGVLTARDALVEYGGFEIAMMAGAMIGAAQIGRAVIVDGFIASAAALAALGLEPDIRPALVFSHRSAEAGHDAVLKHMGAKPLLDLGLRLGEGTGAILAWPMLKASVAMLNQMASFDSASVSEAL